jgi:Cu/Ag efflux pump CusA
MARKRTVLAIALPLGLAALAALLLAAAGGYYGYRWLTRVPPDPVVVEVVAAFPGASTEEVERQVTIPLEVGLAGLPGLQATRSQSSFGLCELRLELDGRTGYPAARQEVSNRLQLVPLPDAVTPRLSAALPRDAVLRWSLSNPEGADGRPVYAPHDRTALRDGAVRRELLCVPGVAAVEGVGGESKRYEVQPDPERLRRYGVTLAQLREALTPANANAGGAGPNVRGVGLIGRGRDPMPGALFAKSPQEAADHLRAEERRRLRELRQVVVATVNQGPVRVEDVVDGGPLQPGEDGERGVVVGRREPEGRRAADGVEAVVLKLPGETTEAVRQGLRARIEGLNATPGRLLPGVQIEVRAEGAAAAGADDFAQAFAAPPGGGLVKIFGPDLGQLGRLADQVKLQLQGVEGVEGVRVLPVAGRDPLEWRVDDEKCARWGVRNADVVAVLQVAFGGATCTQVIEGDLLFDLTVCWPARCRKDTEAILNLPVDVGGGAAPAADPLRPVVVGPVPVPPAMPAPRLRLRDLVTPSDPGGEFVRPGAGAIYREDGARLVAVRFDVQGRDAAKVVAEVQQRAASLFQPPYRAEWDGRR